MTPVIQHIAPAHAQVDLARLLRCIAALETGDHMAKIGLHGERSSWQLTRKAWNQMSTKPWSDAFDRKIAEGVAGKYLAYLNAELIRRGVCATPYRLAVCWRVGLNGIHSDGAMNYGRRCENLYNEH